MVQMTPQNARKEAVIILSHTVVAVGYGYGHDLRDRGRINFCAGHIGQPKDEGLSHDSPCGYFRKLQL
jgi:hypothetical protein